MSDSSPAAPTVSVRGLVFTHPGEREPLLRGLDLELREGGMLAITGPSGAGKTTLLNLIAGLITPQAGRISVHGREISRLSPSARAQWRGKVVGYAYQDARLLPQLDVVTNVAWPLLFGDQTRRQALAQAQRLLERLRLGHLARHQPVTLSGGEQRRVALARALVAHPPLLLVDEPTANLDTVAAAEVMELLAQAQRDFQTAMLIVSHSPEALARCDRRTDLHDGVLAEVALAPAEAT
jgi:ABC-type lipoprotein export system ATPase subunit